MVKDTAKFRVHTNTDIGIQKIYQNIAGYHTNNIKQFQSINELLTDKFYSVQMPNEILIDLDSTDFQTYGGQYGSNYNSHYSANGYHPLVAFDYLTGNFIKAELRAGNV